MKNILPLLILITAVSCGTKSKTDSASTLNTDSLGAAASEKVIAQKDSVFLSKYPLITWARKSPLEIGCMLQTEFSYKDPVFNCDNKTYVVKGNPDDAGYNEGIIFPDDLAAKVDPSIRSIDLDFEHGNLREISVTFKDSILKKRIKQLFGLPSDKVHFPENVMDISYGENIESKDKPLDPAYTKWLTITGFEHMGAGD